MGKRKRLMAERLKEAKKSTAVAKLNDAPTSPRKLLPARCVSWQTQSAESKSTVPSTF